MKQFIAGALLGAGLLLGGSQLAQAQIISAVPGDPNKVVVVGNSADGKTINLSQGNVAQFEFSEQLGTGHSWSATGCSGGSVLALDSVQHLSGPGPGMPGKASVASFTLSAKGPGSCTMTFSYSRPWISPDPTGKTVTVTFNIQ